MLCCGSSNKLDRDTDDIEKEFSKYAVRMNEPKPRNGSKSSFFDTGSKRSKKGKAPIPPSILSSQKSRDDGATPIENPYSASPALSRNGTDLSNKKATPTSATTAGGTTKPSWGTNNYIGTNQRDSNNDRSTKLLDDAKRALKSKPPLPPTALQTSISLKASIDPNIPKKIKSGADHSEDPSSKTAFSLSSASKFTIKDGFPTNKTELRTSSPSIKDISSYPSLSSSASNISEKEKDEHGNNPHQITDAKETKVAKELVNETSGETFERRKILPRKFSSQNSLVTIDASRDSIQIDLLPTGTTSSIQNRKNQIEATRKNSINKNDVSKKSSLDGISIGSECKVKCMLKEIEETNTAKNKRLIEDAKNAINSRPSISSKSSQSSMNSKTISVTKPKLQVSLSKAPLVKVDISKDSSLERISLGSANSVKQRLATIETSNIKNKKSFEKAKIELKSESVLSNEQPEASIYSSETIKKRQTLQPSTLNVSIVGIAASKDSDFNIVASKNNTQSVKNDDVVNENKNEKLSADRKNEIKAKSPLSVTSRVHLPASSNKSSITNDSQKNKDSTFTGSRGDANEFSSTNEIVKMKSVATPFDSPEPCKESDANAAKKVIESKTTESSVDRSKLLIQQAKLAIGSKPLLPIISLPPARVASEATTPGQPMGNIKKIDGKKIIRHEESDDSKWKPPKGSSISPNSEIPPTLPKTPRPNIPPTPIIEPPSKITYQIDWKYLVSSSQRNNLEMMREDLQTNMKRFVVNQLLMSIQFWDNFDRDRETWIRDKNRTDKEMNARLVQLKKRATTSGRVFHHIQDRVGCQSTDPAAIHANVLEPILPTENIIFYDNIEVNRKEDYSRLINGSIQYSSVDEPIYRVCLEPTKHIGYAKLRCFDNNIRRSSSVISEVKTVVHAASGSDDDRLDDEVFSMATKGRRKNYNWETSKAHNASHLAPQESSSSLEVKVTPPSPFTGKLTPDQKKQGKVNDGSAHPSLQKDGMEYEQNYLSTSRALSTHSNSSDSDMASSSALGPDHSVDEQGYAEIRIREVTKCQEDLENDNFETKDQDSFDDRRKSWSVLPKACFRTVSTPIIDVPSNRLGAPLPGDVDKEARTYINSKYFMLHFEQSFYYVLKQLNKSSLINSAKVCPPKMMCRDERNDFPAVDNNNNSNASVKESWQDFVPSIAVSFWPDEAIEWYLRKRKSQRDKRTEVTFVWPPPELIDASRQSGCNLKAVGFIPPIKGFTKDMRMEMNLEWRISFTRAEHILLNSLNAPKLRCYIFSLLLYKTYLAPLNAINEGHIRHLLYWMIESNPIQGWQDETLAVKIEELFHKLKTLIAAGKMPHYFMRKSNMLGGIPQYKLQNVNERIFRTRENFVFFLINMLKGLRYDNTGSSSINNNKGTTGNNYGFYPMLDLDKLQFILTIENANMLRISPELLESSQNKDNEQMNQHEAAAKLDNYRKLSKTSMMSVASTPRAKARDMQNHASPRPSYQNTRVRKITGERGSIHSLASLKSTVTIANKEDEIATENLTKLRMGSPDEARKTCLLEFFTDHFVAMAKESNRKRAYGQGLMYVMQAENLLQLLGEDNSRRFMDFRVELEQIREVLPSYAPQDYWNISYGRCLEDNDYPTRKISHISENSNVGNGMYTNDLPEVPSPQHSPIPGCTMPRK